MHFKMRTGGLLRRYTLMFNDEVVVSGHCTRDAGQKFPGHVEHAFGGEDVARLLSD
jgi:hypothetical protein